MIKKISTIKNFGIFKDFDWDPNVRRGNRPEVFKRLNIIYGRNYSGKTTISRILRSFELGELPDKYPNCGFEIEDSNGNKYSQNNVREFPFAVRVFNEDFIKENLEWLVNENGEIKPFAVLGIKNVKIKNAITKLEVELGSEEDKKGLLYDLKLQDSEYQDSKNEYDGKRNALDTELRNKAAELKETSYFTSTYDIRKITKDIKRIRSNNPDALTEHEYSKLDTFLSEKPKNILTPNHSLKLSLQELSNETNRILKIKIDQAEPIVDLNNDKELENWVRQGINHHKGKRKDCAFCTNKLPDNLWEKLSKHFNSESEELITNIDQLTKKLENEGELVSSLLTQKREDFYSYLHQEYDDISTELNTEITSYKSSLTNLINSLGEKKTDVFNEIEKPSIQDNSLILKQAVGKFNKLVEKNNAATTDLSNKQENAKGRIRDHILKVFIDQIQFERKSVKIEEKGKQVEIEKNKKEKLENLIRVKRDQKVKLESELKDETRAAQTINDYLRHYFGHQALRIDTEEDKDGKESGVKFKVMRDNSIAYNLSKGETSLIAFCYFMAKLKEVKNQGKEIILWIDDPISSLDSNHIFFVFALINSQLALPGRKSDSSGYAFYRQLFLSTHNLDFLKYLKKIERPFKKIQGKKEYGDQYFIIERIDQVQSRMIMMPNYLKQYITEFIYLFHQIFKCSQIQNIDDNNYGMIYNFGNNLRKFLEAYLFFYFPNSQMSNREKLNTIFGDENISSSLITRIEHEFSHLEENPDRSLHPIDLDECKKVASLIINAIEKQNIHQYKSLMKSIGEIRE